MPREPNKPARATFVAPDADLSPARYAGRMQTIPRASSDGHRPMARTRSRALIAIAVGVLVALAILGALSEHRTARLQTPTQATIPVAPKAKGP